MELVTFDPFVLLLHFSVLLSALVAVFFVTKLLRYSLSQVHQLVSGAFLVLYFPTLVSRLLVLFPTVFSDSFFFHESPSLASSVFTTGLYSLFISASLLFVFHFHFVSRDEDLPSRFLVWVPIVNVFYIGCWLFFQATTVSSRVLVLLWCVSCLLFTHYAFFAFPLTLVGIDSASFLLSFLWSFSESDEGELNAAFAHFRSYAHFVPVLMSVFSFFSILFSFFVMKREIKPVASK